jgi:uncharacterized protein (TIGR02246 family)
MVDRTMEPSPLSADDRLDILDLFARYAWAYDCGDSEEYAAVFTDDAVLAGADGHVAVGREAIRKDIERFFEMRGATVWQHYNGHLKIDGNGTRCTVYSYWAVLQNVRAPHEPVEAGNRGVGAIGYYVSRCVKADGRWLFKERRWHFDMPKALPWKAPQISDAS